MYKLLQYLPAGLAHQLAPAGLHFYSELFGQEKSPVWQPLHWRGLYFPNRLGIAGGVDKNGEYVQEWARLGCGFVEVGTVTPLPQTANPNPIIMRDWPQQNLWNKMGFPNQGAKEIAFNLQHQVRELPVFINISKNRQTDNDKISQDCLTCIQYLHPYADAFVINVSSPNTQGLRDLQSAAALQSLAQQVSAASHNKPVLLKLSPDLSESELQAALQAGVQAEVSGFILTNTTLSRPQAHSFPAQGGLSGRSLAVLSKAFLQQALQFLGARRKDFLLISVGGILSPEDVFERLALGADLVQVYSALVFSSPRFFQKTASARQGLQS